MSETTLGESRVLVTYNQEPDHLVNIAKIREMSATLIDFLNEHKMSRTVPVDGEQARVYATAMTEIE
jgi:uncharacterized protein (DUF2336 family)